MTLFVSLLPSAIFAVVLVACALSDVAHYRIPNTFVLVLVLAFFVFAGIHYTQVSWMSQLAASISFLVAGFLLNRFGQMGAGDAKLLAAVGLWTGLGAIVPLLMWLGLCGLAVLSALLLARWILRSPLVARRVAPGGRLPRVLVAGEPVPYGLVIALGGILTLPHLPAWLR